MGACHRWIHAALARVKGSAKIVCKDELSDAQQTRTSEYIDKTAGGGGFRTGRLQPAHDRARAKQGVGFQPAADGSFVTSGWVTTARWGVRRSADVAKPAD